MALQIMIFVEPLSLYIKYNVNRRIMRKTLVEKIMIASVLPLAAFAGNNNRPNVIIINCDDMGYGDLSCYGNPTIRTPELDRMAMEGQKWTSFYVSSPVSSPSRAGLLTGRLGVRTGMYGDKRGVLFPQSKGGLPAEEITMAELFKEAGYQTACIGKWHLGHLPQYMPLQHGFDYFYGAPFSNDMSKREQAKLGNKNYPQEYLIYEQEEVIARDPEQYTLTKRYTEAALKFIDGHRKSPFFVYLAHPMPHFPVYASEAFQGKSDRGKYGDTVEELDWSVGTILNYLRKKKLDKNTLVIFTSDNGPWLPYKQEAGTTGPLRGEKNSHYEGGFRVPCIMWGGMVDPGQVTSMGSTLDLIPTLGELAGYELPKDRVMDGVNLCNVLKDSKKKSDRDCFYFYRGSKLYAVRKGNYKLHFMDKPAYGKGQLVVYDNPVLYDLSTDPEERYDIATKYPEKVEELMRFAEEHKASFRMANSLFDL